MLEQDVKILVVDDDEDDFVIVQDLLSEISGNHFSVHWEPDYEKASYCIRQQDYDIYLIDYRLGKENGLELLREAISINRNKPVIMLTGQGESEVDMEAMKIGAADFLVKNKIDAQIIERSIRYALSNARAMHRLYEQEKKYRTLFEQSVSAIFISDEALQIVDINQAMYDLFGYSRAELMGKSPKTFFSAVEDFEVLKNKLYEKGSVKDEEIELSHKRKKDFYTNITITPFMNSSGNIEGYQGIIEDISERKLVQQELIQLEKLIMTGNIARSIAHEVRNPLTNISLALEQVASDEDDNDNELYFDIIKRNTKRINQLITEMLKSSKPSELKLEPGKLHDLLEDVLAMAEDRLKLQEIKLVKTYDTNLPEVAFDHEKLPLAILNIINNALEAVEPRKGVLSLQTRMEGNYQVMQICDNGPGIAQEEVNRLFDAFHTGKKGGMGLGLTFTQNIVSSHGAKIAVESTLNKGTCFKISLKNQLEKAL